jgi:hypothetical protein
MKILIIEVLAVTLISIISGSTLAYVIIILSKTDLYKYTSGLLILFYIVAMSVFGVLTANRLNKKIFKYSVYQGLREGSE